MGKIWVTSDLHLGHTNIIKYSERPFDSVEEHDERLINNINELVMPDDILYHLGDFCFTKNKNTTPKQYRDRINCRNIHNIWGNHDKDKNSLIPLFYSCTDVVEIRVDLETGTISRKGHPIILFHYSMRTWNKSHFGSWSLYGHSHGQLTDDPHVYSFDCGVDCWNYKPIDIQTIKETMDKKDVNLPLLGTRKHY